MECIKFSGKGAFNFSRPFVLLFGGRRREIRIIIYNPPHKDGRNPHFQYCPPLFFSVRPGHQTIFITVSFFLPPPPLSFLLFFRHFFFFFFPCVVLVCVVVAVRCINTMFLWDGCILAIRPSLCYQPPLPSLLEILNYWRAMYVKK